MAKYFKISEMTRSDTAERNHILNTPNNDITRSLNALMCDCLDPVRALWGKPLGVNSGYRCPALNTAVGGAKTSQHLKGEAADITTGTRDGNKSLFELIMASGIPFDQLIDESGYKWIHISYKPTGNRRQILHL